MIFLLQLFGKAIKHFFIAFPATKAQFPTLSYFLCAVSVNSPRSEKNEDMMRRTTTKTRRIKEDKTRNTETDTDASEVPPSRSPNLHTFE